MKTLIIGLGNPILGDDGVGWVIAREVEARIGESVPNLTVERLSLAGIALMEQIVGYERVILIDSLNTGDHAQGEVVSFSLDKLTDLIYGHSASAHDLSLKKALELGRSMSAELPDDENVSVVAVEAAHVYDFTEKLSPIIAAAVPKAVQKVLDLIGIAEGEKI